MLVHRKRYASIAKLLSLLIMSRLFGFPQTDVCIVSIQRPHRILRQLKNGQLSSQNCIGSIRSRARRYVSLAVKWT